MAAEIDVNIADLDNAVGKIRGIASDFNTNLNDIYSTFQDLSSSWKGTRYKLVADVFNKYTESLNDVLDFVIGELPKAIQQAANNYRGANTDSNATTATEDSARKISDISANADDDTVGYKSEYAHTAQDTIDNKIEAATNNMNEINSAFNGAHWEDPTGQQNKATIAKCTNTVNEALAEIKSTLKNEIEGADNDFSASQTANNFDA